MGHSLPMETIVVLGYCPSCTAYRFSAAPHDASCDRCAEPHVAARERNHLPAKLIRTYDRNKYETEKRAALDQWATHLKIVVAQATGANVTALRNRDSAGGNKR